MKHFLIDMYCRLSVPVWAGIFAYIGWLFLKLFAPVVGIDAGDLDKELNTGQVVSVYAGIIILMIVGALAGCLISYFTVARVFHVPEHQFRQILLKVLTFEPGERLLKRYYFWCFKVAYGKEI